ncbi:MAG: hypothetical protein LBS36_10210 [Oscillospiraceae bacterium]|nr:hypothetical protein [Oscillospiraceae bacterium]
MSESSSSVSAPGASVRLVQKIGFWSSLLSAVFYIAFDTAAILSASGVLTSKYWTSILFYAPSIFLALCFVVMSVSVHYYASPKIKICTHIALAVAGIYATINCFIYIIQVLIIAPSMLSGRFDAVALFEMAPEKPLYAANALAYTLMGVSTLFSAWAFEGGGLAKAIKILFLVHGIAALANVLVLIWPNFLFISATVGILYPAGAILAAVFFKKSFPYKAKGQDVA